MALTSEFKCIILEKSTNTTGSYRPKDRKVGNDSAHLYQVTALVLPLVFKHVTSLSELRMQFLTISEFQFLRTACFRIDLQVERKREGHN